MAPLRERFNALVEEHQEAICARLEALDGGARFSRDRWQRPGGGGGLTRVLAEGALFEKAGVSVSAVHGTMEGEAFWAAGLSLILHPRSPMVPAVHLNVRRIEKGSGACFGGGADLTPCYLFEDDARHFHARLKEACDRFEPGIYARFKAECDRYFYLKHRQEARGVGGIFFDQLQADDERGLVLVAGLLEAFLPAYLPIAGRRRDLPWGEAERRWQLLRRGRYAEFNLVYDRGTRFGLETDGRIESVLVSMPPLASWEYAHEPEAGSREAALLEVLRKPREWVP